MATTPAPSRTDQILERLARLHPRLIDLSLDRVRGLLARLGNPELRLPPVVHVAGTNGKGSLIAYLRAMLEAAGQRVHVYTSPHLVRFNERIRLAGALIEEDALSELLEEVERINAGCPITQFEITTAAALLAFSRQPAEALLLETGLGGEFDATNVLPHPVLCAITPVAYDHMEFLGPTLAEIAKAKAGILKEQVPAVIGPQRGEALAVIEARAASIGAPLSRHGREWIERTTTDGFEWRSATEHLKLPLPALSGAHQIANAATAVACLRMQKTWQVPDNALVRGLSGAEWPARLQLLTAGPLVEIAGAGCELWLDGGHNPHCAAAIAAWATASGRRLDIVLGMKSNKDLQAFISVLAPVTRQLVGIAIPGDSACHSPQEIAAVGNGLGLQASAAASPLAALELLGRGGADRILICGSLYLAGAILRENR